MLIPANPHEYAFDSEERDRSDVDAHMRHANLNGAVYWNLPASGRNHTWFNDVKTAYFVRPSEKASYRCEEVTYKGQVLRIEHFKTKSDMRTRFPVEELNYLYGTRRKVWELESNGGYDWKRWRGVGKLGFIFLKIKNIHPLKEKRNIADFRKALATANDPVKICRKYVIVFDEFYE